MRTSYIYAASGRDSIEFYLEHDRRRYYLFSTRFDYCVFTCFRNGVQLRNVFSGTRNPLMNHIKERIIKSVKYIESEYRLNVLSQNISNRRKRIPAYYPADEEIA